MPESTQPAIPHEALPWLDAQAPRDVATALVALAAVLVLLGVGAAWFVKTDVVVRAPATVVPEGETARVTAPFSGVVARVLVKDGQTVRAGEPLLELDTRAARAEEHTYSSQITALKAEIAMRRELRLLRDAEAQLEDVGIPSAWPSSTPTCAQRRQQSAPGPFAIKWP